MKRVFLSLLSVFGLMGCPFAVFDTVYDERLVGPYRLVAIDTRESMSIFKEAPGGDLVGDGLPGPQVVAAGYDDRVLVAVVHPERCPPFRTPCADHGIDASVTQYWVVIRQFDEAGSNSRRGIRGPFTAEQYARLHDRFRLPDFSVFPTL